MESKNCIFQASKVMEFNCRPLKVIENLSFVWQVRYCRSQIKDNVRQRELIEQRKRHAFRWTPEFVSVELFKVKNTLKHKSFKNKWQLKLRSRKKSWKVLEFEELKRVRTLLHEQSKICVEHALLVVRIQLQICALGTAGSNHDHPLNNKRMFA